MQRNPLQKPLLKFAEEYFCDKHYTCLHGETHISVLTLAIRRKRWRFTRPFTKSEMTILTGLEKYVESEGAEEFRETLNELIASEDMARPGVSSEGHDVDVSGQTEVTIKLHQDMGNIRLGKLTQHYITDPDIRELLAATVLDTEKMSVFNEHEMFLITSVISSDKLVLETGENVGASASQPTQFEFPLSSGRYKGKTMSLGVVTRETPAPLLFKCCKVNYNKETQRLEIPKGKYIGKTKYSISI